MFFCAPSCQMTRWSNSMPSSSSTLTWQDHMTTQLISRNSVTTSLSCTRNARLTDFSTWLCLLACMQESLNTLRRPAWHQSESAVHWAFQGLILIFWTCDFDLLADLKTVTFWDLGLKNLTLNLTFCDCNIDLDSEFVTLTLMHCDLYLLYFWPWYWTCCFCSPGVAGLGW